MLETNSINLSKINNRLYNLERGSGIVVQFHRTTPVSWHKDYKCKLEIEQFYSFNTERWAKHSVKCYK